MKITIEHTNDIMTIDGAPVRVWHGETSSGTKCFVFVTRIAFPEETPDEELSELRRTGVPRELRDDVIDATAEEN